MLPTGCQLYQNVTDHIDQLISDEFIIDSPTQECPSAPSSYPSSSHEHSYVILCTSLNLLVQVPSQPQLFISVSSISTANKSTQYNTYFPVELILCFDEVLL